MIEFETAFKIENPAPKNLLLSIVIPTYNRPDELTQALDTMIPQLTGGLEDKIEIIISDNASTNPNTRKICEEYANGSKNISYYRNVENYGHMKQVIIGPRRARGEFCWVFGDDDIVLDNCFPKIIKLLEEIEVDFLTINRQIKCGKLENIVAEAFNTIPTQTFHTMSELLQTLGINHLGFITSQIFRTAPFLEIDPTPYVSNGAGYQQVAAYIECFYQKPCHYLDDVLFVQRYELTTNENATLNLANNFEQLAVHFVKALETARAKANIPGDIYQNMTGVKAAHRNNCNYTLADQIIEYLYRSIGYGSNYTAADIEVLKDAVANWPPRATKELRNVIEAIQNISKIENDIKSIEQAKPAGKKLSKDQKRKQKKALRQKIIGLISLTKKHRQAADASGLNHYKLNVNTTTK